MLKYSQPILYSIYIFIGPLKKEGENCGYCFCPPTFTAGECEPGLKCDLSIRGAIPDTSAGVCRADNNGAGILPRTGSK